MRELKARSAEIDRSRKGCYRSETSSEMGVLDGRRRTVLVEKRGREGSQRRTEVNESPCLPCPL